MNEVFTHIAKIIIREKLPNGGAPGSTNMGLNNGMKNGGLGGNKLKLEASSERDSSNTGSGGCCK